MARRGDDTLLDFLRTEFPGAQVSPRPDGSTGATVFEVIEGDVERQLEIGRPLMDDLDERAIVDMLRRKNVSLSLAANPGKRVVVHRARLHEGLDLVVDVVALRRKT